MLRKMTLFTALAMLVVFAVTPSAAQNLSETQKIIKARLLVSDFMQICVESQADLVQVQAQAEEREWENIAIYYDKLDLPGYKTDFLWQARISGGSGYAVPYALFTKETETSRICGIQVQQLPGSFLVVGLEKAKLVEKTKSSDPMRTFCVDTYPGNTKGHEILFRRDGKTGMTLMRAEFGKDTDALQGCPPYNRATSEAPEFLTVGAVDW